jgi:hypothetical protein
MPTLGDEDNFTWALSLVVNDLLWRKVNRLEGLKYLDHEVLVLVVVPVVVGVFQNLACFIVNGLFLKLKERFEPAQENTVKEVRKQLYLDFTRHLRKHIDVFHIFHSDEFVIGPSVGKVAL